MGGEQSDDVGRDRRWSSISQASWGTRGWLLGRESDSAARLLASADRVTDKNLGDCRSRWSSGNLGGDAGDAVEIELNLASL